MDKKAVTIRLRNEKKYSGKYVVNRELWIYQNPKVLKSREDNEKNHHN